MTQVLKHIENEVDPKVHQPQLLGDTVPFDEVQICGGSDFLLRKKNNYMYTQRQKAGTKEVIIHCFNVTVETGDRLIV